MGSYRFKKKYGQNFIKNKNIVDRIVSISGVDSDSMVIEVGPGGGVLTRALASVSGNVLAYEVDRDLEDGLNNIVSEYNNIDIIYGDFLERNINKDISNYKYRDLYFVSNVPYYITTPIIIKLIDSKLSFKKIVMMVQKEVGDRLGSDPGSRNYGSITVILNYFYEIKKEFKVSRKEFVPVPNVDSVIVSFTERSNKGKLYDYDYFVGVVRDCFKYKRKNIKNNMKGYDIETLEELLEEYGYDLSVRAEMLPWEFFVDLANRLYKKSR